MNLCGSNFTMNNPVEISKAEIAITVEGVCHYSSEGDQEAQMVETLEDPGDAREKRGEKKGTSGRAMSDTIPPMHSEQTEQERLGYQDHTSPSFVLVPLVVTTGETATASTPTAEACRTLGKVSSSGFQQDCSAFEQDLEKGMGNVPSEVIEKQDPASGAPGDHHQQNQDEHMCHVCHISASLEQEHEKGDFSAEAMMKLDAVVGAPGDHHQHCGEELLCRVCHTSTGFEQDPETGTLSTEAIRQEDAADGVSGDHDQHEEEESICRICHMTSFATNLESLVINLECSCKGDLGRAHLLCAITWFHSRNNWECEICGHTPRNMYIQSIQQNPVLLDGIIMDDNINGHSRIETTVNHINRQLQGILNRIYSASLQVLQVIGHYACKLLGLIILIGLAVWLLVSLLF